MRSEAQFLSASYGGDPAKEYEQFRALGVDGLFTDFPDVAARAFRSAKKD
jgi:glycerophosphoryl diester phosphodiesterase